METHIDYEAIIVSTIIVIIPIAGSISFLFKKLIRVLKSKNLDSKASKMPSKKTIHLSILFLGLIYGILIESVFVCICWFPNIKISQFGKIMCLFFSMPYVVLLFTIPYALGSAVAFGGSSKSILDAISNKKKDS